MRNAFISYTSYTALCFVTCGTGFASMIVQTQGATLNHVGASFSVPLTFNQFNPALGVLNSITLDLDGSFAGTVGIENLSNAPDQAAGIITGTISVATNGQLLAAEVFPSAAGPLHNFTAFDGVLDFAGSSGATDSVSGSPVATSVTALASSPAIPLSTGPGQIFLTLTATSFPIAQGMQKEAVTDTANATGVAQLTYNYTPAAAAPEPATMTLLAGAGMIVFGFVRVFRPFRRLPE